MRVLVLGAGGRTGTHVVRLALGHGHEVTAFVRDASRLSIHDPALRIVEGDVTDPSAVQRAVEGQDAVISTLGSSGERPVNVYSDGVANTIRAMTARGVRRLVVMSASGVGAGGEGLSVRARAMRKLPHMRPVYEDLERMEGDVMLSDLDWTIVRPAALNDGPFTGFYRVVEGSVVPKGSRISRADAAAFLLKVVEADRYVRRSVAVAY